MTDQTVSFIALHQEKTPGLLKSWLVGFKDWRQSRRDLAELKSLSGSALRDLAIDRSELSSIVHSNEGERRRSRG